MDLAILKGWKKDDGTSSKTTLFSSNIIDHVLTSCWDILQGAFSRYSCCGRHYCEPARPNNRDIEWIKTLGPQFDLKYYFLLTGVEIFYAWIALTYKYRSRCASSVVLTILARPDEHQHFIRIFHIVWWWWCSFQLGTWIGNVAFKKYK